MSSFLWKMEGTQEENIVQYCTADLTYVHVYLGDKLNEVKSRSTDY